jgi:hypothetical protein
VRDSRDVLSQLLGLCYIGRLVCRRCLPVGRCAGVPGVRVIGIGGRWWPMAGTRRPASLRWSLFMVLPFVNPCPG